MDRGQIVEVGKHDELLAREGAYYRLYQAQARQAEQDRLEQSLDQSLEHSAELDETESVA